MKLGITARTLALWLRKTLFCDRLVLPEPTREQKQLSDRQTKIVRLVAEGRTSKEIGVILNISFMRKLRLSTLAELVRYAVRSGLIEP